MSWIGAKGENENQEQFDILQENIDANASYINNLVGIPDPTHTAVFGINILNPGLFGLVERAEVNIASLQTAEEGLGTQVEGIETQITGIEGEITGIQGEISTIQGEITGIQGEITGIQFTEIPALSGAISATAGIAGDALVKANKSLGIWDEDGNNTYNMKSGNVAIGILPKGTLLNNKLEVNGSINIPTGFKYKVNNVPLSYSDLAGTPPVSSKWTNATDVATNIYYSTGNVGIGVTSAINNKLEVGGNLNISAGYKYKINNVNLAFSDLGGTLSYNSLTDKLTAGTNISIVGNAINNTLTGGTNISIVSGAINNTYTYTLPTAGVGTGGTLGGVKVDNSTITITNGVISAAAATPQVNSDWTQTNDNLKSFIQNKPTAGNNISFANNTITNTITGSTTQNIIGLNTNQLIIVDKPNSEKIDEAFVPLTNEPYISSPAFTESIRTFTHSGGTEAQTSYDITIGQNTICDILVVGGGGGGGNSIGAGGGAGGLVYITNYTLMAGTYTILVGKGGIGQVGQNTYPTEDGKNSTINVGATNIITALGGGTGQGQSPAYLGNNNRPGGSGSGGTRHKPTGASATQITGTTGISSTFGRGHAGGNYNDTPAYSSAGGGGAGGVGGNGTTTKGGDGGVGFLVNITGTNVYYAGGGGGVSDDDNTNTTNGTGGLGGGGNGITGGNGVSGTNGLGGGGGGGSTGFSGGNGGSGIVIIKFKTIVNAAIPEGNPITHKTLNFTYSTTPPNQYTLSVPLSGTGVIINNTPLQYLSAGNYTISVGATQSSVVIAGIGQVGSDPYPLTNGSTITFKYSMTQKTLSSVFYKKDGLIKYVPASGTNPSTGSWNIIDLDTQPLSQFAGNLPFTRIDGNLPLTRIEGNISGKIPISSTDGNLPASRIDNLALSLGMDLTGVNGATQIKLTSAIVVVQGNLYSTGVNYFKYNVWHLDSDGFERFYFQQSNTTYIKGHGTTPFEFRNGANTNICTISGSGGLAVASYLQGSGAGGGFRLVRPDTWVRMKSTDETTHLNFAAQNIYAYGTLDAQGITYLNNFTYVKMQSIANTGIEYVCVVGNDAQGAYYNKALYIAYGTFTGFHRCYIEDELCNDENVDIFKNEYIGRVVISTGKIKTDASRKKECEENEHEWYSLEGKEGITIEDALPIIQLSRIRKDKRVYGVLGDPKRGTNNNSRIIVNGCGEGAICVANTNGNIENGDYIQTSDLLGYGEKQDDDLHRNYTIAKAVMDCTFELDNPNYECKELSSGVRVAMIACVYKAS